MMQATRSSGVAIYNADDLLVAHLTAKMPVPVLPFSVQKQLLTGGWVEEGTLCIRMKSGGVVTRYPLDQTALKGIHNWQNMLASVLAATFAGVPEEKIREGLASFQGLPHRMQWVRDCGGVHYINDSKGTNVGATEMALQSVATPIVWIAGGRDKGGSYEPLKEKAKGKVRQLILFGEAKEKMRAVLGAVVPTAMVENLQQAVMLARSCAKKGDTILFSPACSSFDQFENYAERGNRFMEWVNKL